MKVLQINSVYNYGSTGKIVENINNLLQSQGYKSYIAYGRITKSEYLNRYRICSTIQNYINGLEARLLDNDGFGIKVTADKLIEYIKEIKPDIIHLHNLHGYYLNIYELITFLKTSQILLFLHFMIAGPLRDIAHILIILSVKNGNLSVIDALKLVHIQHHYLSIDRLKISN
jgi:hypothetical protein